MSDTEKLGGPFSTRARREAEEANRKGALAAFLEQPPTPLHLRSEDETMNKQEVIAKLRDMDRQILGTTSLVDGKLKTTKKESIFKLAADFLEQRTPDASLPPLGDGPRRKMVITIEVTEDFEKRLDNQWMVEREIHADRWQWKWADEQESESVRELVEGLEKVDRLTSHGDLCFCGSSNSCHCFKSGIASLIARHSKKGTP